MLTIVLDESGRFENLKNKKQKEPVFIGGVLYDDRGEQGETDREQKRLETYFRHICDSVGVGYPRGLHFTQNKENEDSVIRVKEKFNQTIKEFLCDGTWSGEPIMGRRQGTYYIYAMLLGTGGKQNLWGPYVSEAVRNDFAGNLYLHMAEDIVTRLLFHNPVLPDIEKVRIDLATRNAVLNKDSERGEEFERLGILSDSERYKKRHKIDSSKQGEQEYYQLTNSDTYRTAIAREMLACGKTGLFIDKLQARSIDYKKEVPDMVFLYLADMVCSYLRYGRGFNREKWLERFDELANDINPGVENLIFSYDEVDDYFQRAWKHLEGRDYYEALSAVYDGSEQKGQEADYYERKWFPKIIEQLERSEDSLAYIVAFQKLREATMKHNVNQDKLLYIYETLECVSNKIKYPNKREEARKYELYDIGISAYTHVGKSEKAFACYEKCMQYKEWIPMERLLRIQNKEINALCDNLEFEKALQVADERVKLQQQLSELRSGSPDASTVLDLDLAIALSQRGQVYSYMQDDRAEADFLRALELNEAGTPDYLITQSYLLHFYISQGQKEKYERCAREYFCGESDLTRQFQVLVEEGAKDEHPRFSLKFSLYLFVKSLYVFYLEALPAELTDQLKDIERALRSISPGAERQINGHPWEIIYKYLALIMLKCGDEKNAERYAGKIGEGMENRGLIIDQIIEQGKAEYAAAAGKQEAVAGDLTYMYT